LVIPLILWFSEKVIYPEVIPHFPASLDKGTLEKINWTQADVTRRR